MNENFCPYSFLSLVRHFVCFENGHRHGDHVMVGDVDHCFRFFQNWHTPELLSEKKYPFNILKDNEFEKSRKVLEAKRKSLVHEHGKGNKLQVAQAIDEDEEDALFEAGEFGDSNPVALQRTV